jgi:hypothetical protein
MRANGGGCSRKCVRKFSKAGGSPSSSIVTPAVSFKTNPAKPFFIASP